MFVGWLVVLFGTVIVVLFVVELGFCFVLLLSAGGGGLGVVMVVVGVVVVLL